MDDGLVMGRSIGRLTPPTQAFAMRHSFVAVFAVVLCVSPLPALAQDPVAANAAAVTTHDAAGSPQRPDLDDADRVAQARTPGPSTIPRVPTPVTLGTLPPVRSLFTELAGNVANVRTADNAMVMIAAGAAASLLHPHDTGITTRVAASPTVTRFFAPGEIVGGFGVQFGGSIATYALGRLTKHQRTAEVGADLVRAQLVTQGFTQAVKLTIDRSRPDGDSWSFPSGHSSGTFASATVLQRHFGWKVGVPAYAVAAYVAGSRLAERRHFASDVIIGAGVGIVSARAVTVGRGTSRFALTPTAVPGRGAGVALTRLAD